MKIVTALSLGSLVTACSLVFGCAGKNAPAPASGAPDDNSDSAESSASSAQSSRLDQMIFSPVASNDPATAANNLANAAEWWPAGCASRSKDAKTSGLVHIHLNDCTGPFGLVHWSGDIDVVFSAGAGGALHAQASSNNLTANGSPVVWSREADITVSGTMRTATGTGTWVRKDRFGEDVTHVTDFTTTIDTVSKCRSSTGTATTKVGAREVDATFTDYEVCREADGSDGCPSGMVSFKHKLSGKTITVTFDGSAQAKISNGSASIEYPLVCGG